MHIHETLLHCTLKSFLVSGKVSSMFVQNLHIGNVIDYFSIWKLIDHWRSKPVIPMVKWLDCETRNHKVVGSNPAKLTTDLKMTRMSVVV